MLPADLAGRDSIELGCGTGYVSAWLARRGARPVGLDNSAAQLATARQLQDRFGLRYPLIHASAEQAPLAEWPEDESVEFHLGHGEMIRLLRGCGLEVEDLLELQPDPDATTRYPFVTLEWARRWPCEEVWKARKAGAEASGTVRYTGGYVMTAWPPPSMSRTARQPPPDCATSQY
jgi:SAM-dependent methyltransferase